MEELGSFVKVYRKFTKWEWYTDINTSRLFIHCLLCANWIEKSWQGTVINRGEFITSLAKLSVETGLTIKQVRLSLDKLKSTGEVACKSTNQYTLINVIKYDDYQDSKEKKGKPNGKPIDEQKTNEGQAEGTQEGNPRATTKEVLEVLELKEKDKDLYLLNKESEKISLFDTFETEFKRPLSQREFMMIGQWKESHEEQLILYALREATVYEKFSFDYIDKILCEWKRKGITVEKYESGEMNE